MMHCALYTRPQADRRLADALTAMGIEAACPIRMEPGKSRGKSRAPEMHERVIIPRVVFARMEPRDYHRVMMHKAGRDILARLDISPREWRHVERFVNDAQEEAEMVLARIRAGEQVAHYREGEALQIIGGPLAGQIMRFLETVKGIDDLTIRIRGKVAILGGDVPATVDPLLVRKAV